MKKLLKAVVVMAMVLGLAGGAYAGSTLGSMWIDAYPQGAVILSIDSILDFGGFDNSVSGNTVPATGQISVFAANGFNYNVTIDAGVNYSGTSRQVSDGTGSYLAYNLYHDATYTTEWGDSGFSNTYPVGAAIPGTGTGAWQPYTVHGLLTTDSMANGAFHNDMVTVTAIW